MIPSEARAKARDIAARLFREGEWNEARRLVLENTEGRDVGGWCRNAVVDVIASALVDGPVEE